MQRLSVTVVGCGIAGAAVATMLSRAGHRVTLLEQSQRVGPAGAGILLQPAGQDVLREMDLLERVISRAEPIRSIEADRKTGRGDRRLVRLRYDQHGHDRHAFGLHRGDLFAVLHDALLDAGVDLRLGERATDVQQLAGARDLVVLADGSRSTSRDFVDPQTRVHEYTHGALWAVGRCDSAGGRLFQIARGTRTLCGLLPMGEGRCSLFWGLPLHEHDALAAAGFDAWRNDVLQTMPHAESMFDRLSDFEDLTLATYRHVSMKRWHRGNVVVLGDAAHAMSPHLGQGVNLALCDAAELARCVDGHAEISNALARYERVRRRQLRWYATITRLLSPFFQGDRGWLSWSRDRTLPWLPRVPGAGRLMLSTLRGEALL